MTRFLAPLLLLLLLSGCGAWEFVSIPHSYQEPPELPLEGLGTYAVVLEGLEGAELTKSVVVEGLKRVEAEAQADVLVRITLGELADEPMEVFQRAQWEARGERAFDDPRFGVRWRYTIPLSYELVDRSRDRVLRGAEKEYAGLFQRAGMIFSTESAAKAWFGEHKGSEWVTALQRAEAAHAGIDLLQRLVEEVTTSHPRQLRLRIAKDSPELDGFQRAYVALRDTRRAKDAEAALEIYQSIGNPLHAADDPEDAIRHRQAVSCGLAACAFLLKDYRAAKKHAQDALGHRSAKTLEDFLPHCDTMIERTELPAPKPPSRRRAGRRAR